jgi:hypothetical protein
MKSMRSVLKKSIAEKDNTKQLCLCSVSGDKEAFFLFPRAGVIKKVHARHEGELIIKGESTQYLTSKDGESTSVGFPVSAGTMISFTSDSPFVVGFSVEIWQ